MTDAWVGRWFRRRNYYKSSTTSCQAQLKQLPAPKKEKKIEEIVPTAIGFKWCLQINANCGMIQAILT